jgi:kynureninase
MATDGWAATSENDARRRDENGPDGGRRREFRIPPAVGGRYLDSAYMAGNSLGLQPVDAAAEVAGVLQRWALEGVEAQRGGTVPWVNYHELLRDASAGLVGAEPDETVVMNSLTVNLHLMMASFYRPEGRRRLVLMEERAFPSDRYAVDSQVAWHGLNPSDTVVVLRPQPAEDALRTEDVVAAISERGPDIAMVLLGGVNFLSGELLDIPEITEAAHRVGAVIGWDLAHATGNVVLRLHDWDVDWAAWCGYKYLNGGPGAPSGVFVHRRHLGERGPGRLAGWWGTNPAVRFEMRSGIDPPPSADAWQLSCPAVLAMAPLRVSLAMFAETGMEQLVARSRALTGYLAGLLDDLAAQGGLRMVTPADPERRGCQLSVQMIAGEAEEVAERLRIDAGVIADVRPPDLIRFAPTPLYSTFHDCWRAADGLASVLRAG